MASAPPLPMPTQIYPSFGRCIYCLKGFPADELTDEHIIPLQLEGQALIEDACCEPCRKRSNIYEHKAMYADLLVPRLLLGLKRARRKKTPPSLPPVVLNPSMNIEEAVLEKRITLEIEQYPPILSTIILESPGLLAGINRSGDLQNVRFYDVHTGNSQKAVPGANRIMTSHLRDHTSLALTVAKIGYCFGIASVGLCAFDTKPIRDLLAGHRGDVYNFVGSDLSKQLHRRRHMHWLQMKKRSGYHAVTVYLFGGYGMPPYEVALGPI